MKNKRTSWNKGLKKKTDGRVASQSRKMKGRKHTEETKKRMRGRKAWNKGKTYKLGRRV